MAQSEVSKLVVLPAASAGQKVLFISPHADDESIAAGGYIAQSVINGADVTIIMVTDSNAQGREATRYAEFKKATGVLGVPESNLVFISFPDSKLDSINQTALLAELQPQIAKYNPDIIIYPSSHDYNSDHRAIGRAIESILKTESTPITAYNYLVHYKLDYPKPRGLAPADYIMPPDHLVRAEKEWRSFGLSPSIESCKEKAIYIYQSQIHNPELSGLMKGNIRKNEIFAISNLQ